MSTRTPRLGLVGAWLAARAHGARAIRRAHHGGGYRLCVRFADADADAVLSVDYDDRTAALTRARELARAGAWVSVFGGEHDLDPRLIHLARLRPGAPRPTAWELVAEFPPSPGAGG